MAVVVVVAVEVEVALALAPAAGVDMMMLNYFCFVRLSFEIPIFSLVIQFYLPI